MFACVMLCGKAAVVPPLEALPGVLGFARKNHEDAMRKWSRAEHSSVNIFSLSDLKPPVALTSGGIICAEPLLSGFAI